MMILLQYIACTTAVAVVFLLVYAIPRQIENRLFVGNHIILVYFIIYIRSCGSNERGAVQTPAYTADCGLRGLERDEFLLKNITPCSTILQYRGRIRIPKAMVDTWRLSSVYNKLCEKLTIFDQSYKRAIITCIYQIQKISKSNQNYRL